MNEIWKPVNGYEDLYEVSNYGRVRCIKNGYIKKTYTQKNGYVSIHLSKNDITKNYLIHRLVALAFIQNNDPTNKTEVNHKDEDKTNNCADNLEWCTRSYNMSYGGAVKRMAQKHSNPVIQYTLEGEYVNYFNSSMEVKRCYGFDNSLIGLCCKGVYKQAYGYIWRYASDIA